MAGVHAPGDLGGAGRYGRGHRDCQRQVGRMTRKNPLLVTGGAGYVGSHVLLAFRDAGYA